MIDITAYLTRKAAGTVSIQKIDDNNFAVAYKQFDAATGGELPAQVTGVTLAGIDAQIAELEGKIAQYNTLKADCQGA